MPLKIAILEDNAERRQAMHACLRDRFPQYSVRFFVTAVKMLAYLQLHESEVLAMALDHDLDLVPGAGDRLFEPGTGRDIADVLATRPPSARSSCTRRTFQPAWV